MRSRVLIAAAAATLITEAPIASIVLEAWPGLLDHGRATRGKAWARDKDGGDQGGDKGGRGEGNSRDGGKSGGKSGSESTANSGGSAGVGNGLGQTTGGSLDTGTGNTGGGLGETAGEVGVGGIGSPGNPGGGLLGGETAASSNDTGGVSIGGIGGSSSNTGSSPAGSTGGSSNNTGRGSGGNVGAGQAGTNTASRGGTPSGGTGPSSRNGGTGTQTGGRAPGTPAASNPIAGGPATVGSIAGVSGVQGTPDLPSGLEPGDGGGRGSVLLAPNGALLRGAREDVARVSRPLSPVPGTPTPIVQACWQSLAAAAVPHGAIRLEATSAGQPTRGARGDFTAPIEARVIYARGELRQVRQSQVTCHLDSRGQVLALD